MTSSTDHALSLIRELGESIGPRRPTSAAERRAAEFIAHELAGVGTHPRLEDFRGPSTFAWAQAWPLALAMLRPGIAGVLAALAEGELRLEPASRLASVGRSQNVVAVLEPEGRTERTVVLVSHLDSSRSGLLFHPRLAPHLRAVTGVVSAAMAAQALSSRGSRSRLKRRVLAASRGVLASGLALLAERELRGRDVPGANDNASGVAVATVVACELASRPPMSTRVIILGTGCEESGTAGMRAFLERRGEETRGWIFLNLDGVGAPASLRYLPREGVSRIYRADPRLLQACESLARRRPDLGLVPAERLVGLTYDSTPVLARGGHAVTLSAQDRRIPNYHTQSDVPRNIDRDVVRRALEAVRELIAAIDRGECD